MMKKMILLSLVLVSQAIFLFYISLQKPSGLLDRSPTATLDILPEKLRDFNHLLKLDPECLSPCWWGYELGNTDINLVTKFLSEKFGSQIPSYLDKKTGLEYWNIDLTQSELQGRAGSAKLVLVASNQVFTGVSFHTSQYSEEEPLSDEFLIPNVIGVYGSPDEVWIDVSRNTPVVFIYYDHQLKIEYVFRFNSFDFEQNFQEICPDIKFLFVLHIISSSAGVDSNYEEQNNFVNVYDELNISPEELAESFLKSPAICINVPIH